MLFFTQRSEAPRRHQTVSFPGVPSNGCHSPSAAGLVWNVIRGTVGTRVACGFKYCRSGRAQVCKIRAGPCRTRLISLRPAHLWLTHTLPLAHTHSASGSHTHCVWLTHTLRLAHTHSAPAPLFLSCHFSAKHVRQTHLPHRAPARSHAIS